MRSPVSQTIVRWWDRGGQDAAGVFPARTPVPAASWIGWTARAAAGLRPGRQVPV